MFFMRFLRIVQIILIRMCLQEVILLQLCYIQYTQFYSLPTVYLQNNPNKEYFSCFQYNS